MIDAADRAVPLTVQELYAALRSEILHGDIAPGAIVSQVKLAERLNVNRTPLREALRMLERDGLIVGEYNRRVCVADLSKSDLEQLYALRIVQEAAALRISIPSFTDADIGKMHELLSEMDVYAKDVNFRRWEDLHRELHRTLVAHAGDLIVKSVTDLSDYCERYRRVLVERRPVSTLMIGAGEHAAVVGACESRDSVQAPALLARHLGRTALTWLSIMDPTHDARAVRESLRLVIGEVDQPTPFVA